MNWPRHLLKVLPVLPPGWITGTLCAACGSRGFRSFLRKREAALLASVGEPERVLVIADVNIGDSINIQPAAEVLKDRFPASQVDYVHSAVAAALVENNPALSRKMPLFRGRFIPAQDECEELRRLGRSGDYDLILSFCPFLPENVLAEAACPVITPVRLICRIIHRASQRGGARAGMAENLAAYVGQIAELCCESAVGSSESSAFSTRIYLTGETLRRREAWLQEQGISRHRPMVFFNPDASNRYTLPGRDLQVGLLRGLLSDDVCGQVLLGSGFTYEGIEQRILAELNPSRRRKITVVPRDLPIQVYAALADACDAFITPDTGPMHIAAARKVCVDDGEEFRNRTSVIGLFGSTLSRIYGYDSSRAGYTPANQDVSSRVFQARCPRKNLTCSLARIAEQCPGDSCFRGVDPDEVAHYVLGLLRESSREPQG